MRAKLLKSLDEQLSIQCQAFTYFVRIVTCFPVRMWINLCLNRDLDSILRSIAESFLPFFFVELLVSTVVYGIENVSNN